MIRGLVIRPVQNDDHAEIRALVDAAFGGQAESRLVDALRHDGDVVLELVARHEGRLYGHVLFSRLRIDHDGQRHHAVALAPLCALPDRQRTGIGKALVENAHAVLSQQGERLSVVLGDAAYYGRFGYTHERAAGFESNYQGEHLQALAWGDAPSSGRLVYAPAFARL